MKQIQIQKFSFVLFDFSFYHWIENRGIKKDSSNLVKATSLGNIDYTFLSSDNDAHPGDPRELLHEGEHQKEENPEERAHGDGRRDLFTEEGRVLGGGQWTVAGICTKLNPSEKRIVPRRF